MTKAKTFVLFVFIDRPNIEKKNWHLEKNIWLMYIRE